MDAIETQGSGGVGSEVDDGTTGEADMDGTPVVGAL